MKKILLTIAIVLTMFLGVNAQTDGFFREGNSASYGNRGGEADLPSIPSGNPGGIKGDVNGDPTAPLGSGLLVLTALGAGYALRKRDQ